MRVVSTFLFVALITVSAWGQISLTSLRSAYTQDFNTLASSGTSSTVPAGWAFSESGTNANTAYTAGTGSGTAGDTYSFGSLASTDRAFGGLRSSSLAPTIGASFTNNTGSRIISIYITYTGEEWRLGTRDRFDRLDFQLSTDATGLTNGSWIDYNNLDFQTPDTSGTAGLRDGNQAQYRTGITYTINGLSIANGSAFWIRWVDLDATGSDDGLAVDDFSLTPLVDNSLPVTMKGTTARVNDGKVSLNFATATEVDIAGFNIFRAILKNGPFELISSYASNMSLKACGSSTSGGSYTFVDRKVSSGQTYYYRIDAVNKSGKSEQVGGIIEVAVDVPKEFELFQNYPNPFNPTTTIRLYLKEPSNVTLDVYDVLGRRVEEWNYGMMDAGRYGKEINMDRYASGVYYYRISVIGTYGDKFSSTKRMVLMK